MANPDTGDSDSILTAKIANLEDHKSNVEYVKNKIVAALDGNRAGQVELARHLIDGDDKYSDYNNVNRNNAKKILLELKKDQEKSLVNIAD